MTWHGMTSSHCWHLNYSYFGMNSFESYKLHSMVNAMHLPNLMYLTYLVSLTECLSHRIFKLNINVLSKQSWKRHFKKKTYDFNKTHLSPNENFYSCPYFLWQTFLLSSSSCSSFIEEEKFQKWDHDASLCLSSDVHDR